MNIKEFLAKNPSLPEICEFVEREAQIIANQRKKENEKLQQEILHPVLNNISSEAISDSRNAEGTKVK